MNIVDACRDPNLFARWFGKPSWEAWFVFLRALFGLPLSEADLTLWRACTGRQDPPTGAFSEAWLVCGRRAGKSFVLALCAVFLACFRDVRANLAPGERGTVLVIATDRRQARVIFRYVRALLREVPMLRRLVEREAAEVFDLSNSMTIEVATASYRTTRGYTIAAALCDEIAFWPTDDSAQPDYAILDALRPGMATIPGAMLLCASSPHARRGALWDAHRRHHGRAGAPALVWQAPTRVMNPSLPERVVAEAYERDPAVAAAEFGALFRSDVEGFVTREAVEACVEVGVLERPPFPERRYVAFVDPSGGSADSMTLAVAHREGDAAVIDATRERRPPFSPEAVVSEFAELLRSYRVRTVTGDRYAGEWPREVFRRRGIEYRPASRTKSELYGGLLPALNSRRVSLLDEPRLAAQLVGLERRTARGGRDVIDHAPGGHDDVANAVAGAVEAALGRRRDFEAAFAAPVIIDEIHRVL